MASPDLQPLHGQTIVVTRMPDPADNLCRFLRAAGAEIIEAPTIEVRPIQDYGAVDEALKHIDRYHWLVLTSAHGADAMLRRLDARRLGISHLARTRIAAIGPATTGRLIERGIQPDLTPPEAVGESLAQSLIAEGVREQRILLLVADIARTGLVESLQAAGAVCDSLTVYRTECPAALPAQFLEKLDRGQVDWITLTSPSTFSNLLKLLGPQRSGRLRAVNLASIGPVTSQAVRDAGFNAAVEAKPHDVPGLVSAIIAASTRD